jgi:hemerythrin
VEKISWNNEIHSVGNRLMDEHHQQLFNLVNLFIDLYCEPDPQRKTYYDSLKKLSDYAQKHFRTEEWLLSEQNYPLLQEQEAEHSRFEDRVIRYTVQLDLNQLPELVQFLVEWLVHHILEEDMKYKPYLEGQAEE